MLNLAMIDLPYVKDLCQPTTTKVVMLVVDGLGGLPHPETRKSELESADLPNLNRLASESACGLTTPVAPGVTPGSGPGHLALFGYDPIRYVIGRGVLEALGIDVELRESDVAARGNLCTVDGDGLVVDRRAGRVSSPESVPLLQLLDRIEVPGAALDVYPVREHRFVLVLRGEGLGEKVSETDPQAVGVPDLEARALSKDSEATATAVNAFVASAQETLGGRSAANSVLLRGFSRLPQLPDMGEIYRLTPAVIASYPMYRGIARLVGMEVLATGETFDDQLNTLAEHFGNHDFFFLHYKPADSAGEDGDFQAKVAALEGLDARLPRLLALGPDTLVVAGDHSTPAIMARHSWHPVPLLVHAPLTKGDGVAEFTERGCAGGSMGRVSATSVMMTALAHAGKLRKFGP